MKGINTKELKGIRQDLDDIRSRFESVKEDAEAYYNEKSEKWQEGDNGQLMDEKIGELDEAINDVEKALEGMLAPEFKEVVLGHAEVRQIISIPKGGVVGGSYIQDGKMTSKAQVRVIRGGIVIHDGIIESLRRFKDDVKEVASGYECGITVERYRDLKEGDVLEAYIMEEIKRG